MMNKVKRPVRRAKISRPRKVNRMVLKRPNAINGSPSLATGSLLLILVFSTSDDMMCDSSHVFETLYFLFSVLVNRVWSNIGGAKIDRDKILRVIKIMGQKSFEPQCAHGRGP